MAAGWIAQGPDQPAAPEGGAPAAPAADGWTAVGPDTQTIPSAARPHQQPNANAIENTRGILGATRDVLFGHAPSSGDPDKATNYGIFPSIKDSLEADADKVSAGPDWSTLASAYPHVLKAQLQQVGAGYQEGRGASQVATAGMQLAALNTLPQAAARVPGNDEGAKIDAMAKDPAVKKAAISVGLDPVVFAHQWSEYSGLTPEQQADAAAAAQRTLEAGRSNLTAGKSSRLQAWADQTAWAPSDLLNGKLDPWTLKGLAFNTALAVPDMAVMAGATVAGTAVGGPAVGLGAGAATAAALFAPAQRSQVKDQIDGQVDTLLQKADQVDAQAPVGGKRGLNPVSSDLRQQAANLAASSDKIADTAAFFYAGADAAGALPVAAVLSRAPGGQAILNRIIGAGLSKTAGGRVASAMIANGAGGMVQAALQKGIQTGVVHESQSLSDALKDIAYTGVVSAITAAPIAGAHEAAGAPARAAAARSLEEDELLSRAKTAADAMSAAQGKPDETYPGYRWNDATGKYEPTAGNAAATAAAPRLTGTTSGTAPGATETPSPATNGPSGETNPASGATNPSKAETYQAKVETLNAAAAKAEKRSDLSLQPEEEGWSIHVNGAPVATFETAANAREALAQARKLVGTSTQRNDVGSTPPGNPAGAASATNDLGAGTQKIPEDTLEQTQPLDRRQDSGLRTRVDQMTPEQMKAALLTHELTGIPNRRAYEDSVKKPAQASVDVDSLKWINDNAGHEGGDQMLKAVAQALHEASGGNAYHISGDEFVVQGDTPAQAQRSLADAQERLAGATLTFQHPDGRTVELKGIGVSHGIGKTLDEADTHLGRAKSAREQSGVRAARGTQPPGASVGTAQAGLQTEIGVPTAAQEAGLPGRLRAPTGEGSAGAPQHAVVLGQQIEHPAVPTRAQAEAGNYFKPTVQWHGLPIKLENLAGSKRPFVYPNGKPGTRSMRNHYGYFPGHEGADQDGVDAFIGGNSKLAHIVDQLNPSTGAFDEHKVIVGSPDTSTAEALYHSNYQKDWKGFGAISQVSREELEHWLHHGDLSKPYAWKAPPKTLEQHLAHPETRAELERMAGNAGWAEVGGKMIRKELNGGRGNEYDISRTKWIPKEPWFQDLAERLPANSRGYEESLKAAAAGGKLSALERRVLTDMAERASLATTDWRHPLTPEQLDALPSDQQRARLAALEAEEARLEAEAERRAIEAEGRGEAIAAGGDEDIPFAKGQGDLFGNQRTIANEILKAREAIDKKLGKGKDVSVETGRPDDLFSQSRQQADIEDVPPARRSPAGAVGKNLSVDQVHGVVDKILAGFRTKPTDVVVVPNLAALRAHPDFSGRPVAHDTHALMDPTTGKIFMIADQIHSKEYAAQLLAHEYVVHFGLRAAFGSRRSTEYRAILDGVAKAAPSMLREEWEQQFPGRAYKPLSQNQRLIAAEEVLARHSEDYIKDPSSVPGRLRRFLDRLHGLLRDWIRKVLGLPAKFDELFMRRTLADLESFLRRGSSAPRSPGSAEAEPATAQAKDTFYSGLARAVDAAKREKGTGAEWEATLRNMPGVKGEEIAWTGLKDWLEGRGRVSKAEVADYVAAHRVNLEEVIKSSNNRAANFANIEKLRDMGYQVHEDDVTGQPYVMQEDGRGISNEVADGDLPDAARDLLHELRTGIAAPPKYAQWATPGGENYRELLMTLSPFRAPGPDAAHEEFVRAMTAKYKTRHFLTNLNPQEFAQHVAFNEPTALAIRQADRALAEERYQSRHWDEPNVLAHVRFDDRTGPQGERILHVHEIQSDWHQEGRRRGYSGGPEHIALKARMETVGAELREARQAAAEALESHYGGPTDDAYAMMRNDIDDPNWRAHRANLPPSVLAQMDRYHAAYEELRETQRKLTPLAVPHAPFKTTWPDLAMKRMLRMAAEGGYDALSWDTGDTNAERYNMQQVADTVNVRYNNVPKTYDLVAKKDTTTVHEQNGMTEENLVALLGKDAAQKIITQRDSVVGNGVIRLTGQDLKIGGAGMRGFYDDILPKKVQGLVKKWGSSVERGEVAGGSPENPRYMVGQDTDRAWRVVDMQSNSGYVSGDHASQSDAQAHADALNERDAGVPIPAHVVRITPAMRDSVLEGQPMFKRKPPGPPKGPKPPGPLRKGYDLGARAVASIPGNELSLSLRRIADPVNISSSSKATALVAREAFGELAQASEEALKSLERFAKAFDLLPHSDRMEFIYAMEEGKPQPNQAHQPAADAMRQLMDDWRERIRDLGIGALDNFIENYFPHIWKDPDGAKKWFGQIFGRRPLKGPASFLKERTIPTTREGIEKGFVPVSTNPLVLVFAKVREMQRFYTGVKLMQRFKDEGLARFVPAHRRAPEGFTEINDAVGRVRQWSEAEQGFIERGKYVMPTDAARVINNHLGASALRNFLPAQLFRSLTNIVTPLQLSFSGFHLGFTTLDAIVSKNALGVERLLHGEPIRAAKAFLEANSVVGGVALNLHRGNALLKAYSNISGATPEMRRIVEGLMAASGRVKMDNYYAAGQGKSPFRQVGFLNLAHEVKAALTQPEGKLLEAAKVMGGFPREYATRLMGDLREIWETHPGMAKLAVPLEVGGRAVRASTAIIMEHLVPLQKLGVFSDLAADHIRRNPGEDPVAFAQGMQSIWNSVDNRLGEMVYDNVFWNRTFKDVSHLSVRAVGWNLGTIRELGGAPVDVIKTLDYLARGAPAEDVAPDLKGGAARIEYERAKHTMDRVADKVGHKIAYTLALVGTTMVLGAITNALFGQKIEELKDYFFPKTGALTKYGTPERITLPSYMKDIYEYASQPVTTLINKANPMFGIIHALSANEDFYGDPTRGDPDAPFWTQVAAGAKYAIKATVPFSIQGTQHFKAAEEHPGLKVAPYFGATPAPARITSPEQMERYQHSTDQKAYAKKLQRDMRKAVADGDQVKAAELREELIQEKMKVKQTDHAIREDKIRARDAANKISSLVQGKSKPDAVAALHAAGFPAFAALWQALPDQPRPRVAQSLEAFA